MLSTTGRRASSLTQQVRDVVRGVLNAELQQTHEEAHRMSRVNVLALAHLGTIVVRGWADVHQQSGSMRTSFSRSSMAVFSSWLRSHTTPRKLRADMTATWS